MAFHICLAPAFLSTVTALHFGGIDSGTVADRDDDSDFGFGDYKPLGYFEIEKAMKEGTRRVVVGTGKPGLPGQADSGNSIGQYFHSHTCLNTPPSNRLPQLRYNPALIVLPAAVKARFGRKAHYLVTLRHDNGQCWNLGNGSTGDRKSMNWFSSIAVLRKDFSSVASAELHGSDCRLLVDGDQVYITRVFRDAQVHMNTIDVSPNGTYGLNVEFGEELGPFGVGERNLGMFKHDGSLMLLKMIREGSMDVSQLIQTKEVSTGAPAVLHNSINPLELPEQNAFLGIGHAHLENICTAPQCKKSGPRYGWKYVSTFFLFDREPPWAMRRMSPPFCIPSPSNSSRCETIQFIVSAIREGSDLLLTYGINDCEAAAVRVPLKRVLDFVETGAPPAAGSEGANLLVAPAH